MKKLTKKQEQVLIEISRGSSTDGIAISLGCTVSNVEQVRMRIVSRMDAKNMYHAIALAYWYGILSPSKMF